MDGLLRCSRYAFGPNRLHYCGPDANREIFDYIQESHEDMGLRHLMEGFQTMYPYLRLIAESNNIQDVFNSQVVDAYWIGNNLLETAGQKHLFSHLLDDQKIKSKYKNKDVEYLIEKVRQGAVPHHSFHVLDVWRQGNKFKQNQSIEPLESCRISWGTIEKLEGPFVTIKSPALIIQDGKLVLSDPVTKKITRPFEARIDIEELQVGDIVAVHWEVVCEKISEQAAKNLEFYTRKHITLANQTI